jgi:cell division protein FtsB
MTPEAEIALAALAFTVFCAIAGLIWRASDQNSRVKHQEAAYVAIHRRIDDLEKSIAKLELTLAVLVDRSPTSSHQSVIPIPR